MADAYPGASAIDALRPDLFGIHYQSPTQPTLTATAGGANTPVPTTTDTSNSSAKNIGAPDPSTRVGTAASKAFSAAASVTPTDMRKARSPSDLSYVGPTGNLTQDEAMGAGASSRLMNTVHGLMNLNSGGGLATGGGSPAAAPAATLAAAPVVSPGGNFGALNPHAVAGGVPNGAAPAAAPAPAPAGTPVQLSPDAAQLIAQGYDTKAGPARQVDLTPQGEGDTAGVNARNVVVRQGGDTRGSNGVREGPVTYTGFGRGAGGNSNGGGNERRCAQRIRQRHVGTRERTARQPPR